jgi:hypothetical protein
VAGTFNGGVALVSVEAGKVIGLMDKVHKCYVSSMCTLTQFEDRFACSISADAIIVW